jgi:arsenical pump membrane protein
MLNILIWTIAILSTAGIIVRPFKLPEATWAVTGAVLLVALRLLMPSEAFAGIRKGTDVYLFLTGMMLLSESAREEKLFDWLALQATSLARGSSQRLFLLIYLVGVVVTALLSNDATAVVLTPAVAAVVKTAKVKQPLPFLLTCAFVANAASFVLPISNPANLVIYGNRMPPLIDWLRRFTLPSFAAIVVTFLLLRFTQRKVLLQSMEQPRAIPALSTPGKLAGIGIIVTAAVLLVSSAADIQLGMPTLIAGGLTSLVISITGRQNPLTLLTRVSWSVLPLVAGLFVIVEALDKTGVTGNLARLLGESADRSITATAFGSGTLIAFASNLVNNLPAGLIAANVVQAGPVPAIVRSSILVGVDLGPNLSITGSLATILWLVALRRENLAVSAWTFLQLGALIMTFALVVALAALWV